jgi:hypothetical protein
MGFADFIDAGAEKRLKLLWLQPFLHRLTLTLSSSIPSPIAFGSVSATRTLSTGALMAVSFSMAGTSAFFFVAAGFSTVLVAIKNTYFYRNKLIGCFASKPQSTRHVLENLFKFPLLS